MHGRQKVLFLYPEEMIPFFLLDRYCSRTGFIVAAETCAQKVASTSAIPPPPLGRQRLLCKMHALSVPKQQRTILGRRKGNRGEGSIASQITPTCVKATTRRHCQSDAWCPLLSRILPSRDKNASFYVPRKASWTALPPIGLCSHVRRVPSKEACVYSLHGSI